MNGASLMTTLEDATRETTANRFDALDDISENLRGNHVELVFFPQLSRRRGRDKSRH